MPLDLSASHSSSPLIMTTGELDFNDNFIERDVFYPFLYAFWIIFVIVMPVLFNNLLVRSSHRT